jgi:hypothetical protein
MGIPLWITSSMMRNPPEEWVFHCELPAQGLGIHRRNGFLPGITSSWMRNPLMDCDYAGNHQLMDAESGRQDQNARKIPTTVTIPGSVVPRPPKSICFSTSSSTSLQYSLFTQMVTSMFCHGIPEPYRWAQIRLIVSLFPFRNDHLELSLQTVTFSYLLVKETGTTRGF